MYFQHPSVPCPGSGGAGTLRTRLLVLAGFLRSQIAALFHPGQIETCGRKFRDFRSGSSAEFDFEDMGPDQFTGCAFVYGEEPIANPVPAVIAVRIVDSYHDL